MNKEMSPKELYRSIISREIVLYNELKEGMRIAAVLPSDELDIMKIQRLVRAPAPFDYKLPYGYMYRKPEWVAIAKVCPGQASMRLKSDDTLYLNKLLPTGVYIHLLTDTHRAHWIYVREHPIVRVTKSEMRSLQEVVEELYPELR